jgi:hypothetical protein
LRLEDTKPVIYETPSTVRSLNSGGLGLRLRPDVALALQNCLNQNLRSTQARWRSALTTDEFYTLAQMGIVVLAFVALVLTFAYLAYEKS